jgi:hypothetical protein
MQIQTESKCRDAGTGRQAGLRIQCPQGRAGSIPVLGTVKFQGFVVQKLQLRLIF